MNPVDHVVADVQGAGAFGEKLDLEGIPIPDGLEGVIPPPSPLHKSGAHGLGNTRVDVVDDGLHRVTDGSRRIHLLEPVPADDPSDHGLAQGSVVVHPGRCPKGLPRIPVAWLDGLVGELHKGLMYPEAGGCARGRNTPDALEEGPAPSSRSCRTPLNEGELSLDFRVVGEALGHGEVDGGPIPIELVTAQSSRNLGLV